MLTLLQIALSFFLTSDEADKLLENIEQYKKEQASE